MTDTIKTTPLRISAVDLVTGEIIHSKIRIYGKNDPPPHSGISFTDDPGYTQQHFREECDINNILDRYAQTGIVPERHGAFYGDFSEGLEYREALDRLQSTQSQFNGLPARTRDFFQNNPAAFLDFVSKPENRNRFHEIGLVEAEIPAPAPADTVAPKASSEAPGQLPT